MFIFLTSIEYTIFDPELVAKLKTVCEISVNNSAPARRRHCLSQAHLRRLPR
jgi:hypothetical protein